MAAQRAFRPIGPSPLQESCQKAGVQANFPTDPGRAGLRVVLAYNPEAGNFSAARLARLHDALVRQGHRVISENSRDFRVPARPGQIDLACLFGGDGTARSVIGRNADAAANTAYCVYPAGTVNLLARETHYPRDAAGFMRRLGAGRAPAPHYFGRVGGEAFLCCASVGPDSAIVADVSPAAKRRLGRLAYLAALARRLRRWPRQAMTLRVDGKSFAAEAVYVCKGRYYAGPWVLDRAASLQADHFRVLILPQARRRDILRLVLSAILGPALADPRWIRLSGRQIEVTSQTSLPIQADGDIVAMTPATITIAPDPLWFV